MIAFKSSNSNAKHQYIQNKTNTWGLVENVLLPILSDAYYFVGIIFLLVKETVAGSNLYSGYNVYGQNVFNNCIKIGYHNVDYISAYYAPLDS